MKSVPEAGERTLKHHEDRTAHLNTPTPRRKPKRPIVVYAGFWRRFFAFIIDEGILSIITVGIIAGFFFMSANAIYPVLVTFIVWWAYYAGMESSTRQATIGKMVMGIIVTDLKGYGLTFRGATIRYLGKILSSILCIGFIMIAFTKRKQALHDKIAECVVVIKVDE